MAKVNVVKNQPHSGGENAQNPQANTRINVAVPSEKLFATNTLAKKPAVRGQSDPRLSDMMATLPRNKAASERPPPLVTRHNAVRVSAACSSNSRIPAEEEQEDRECFDNERVEEEGEEEDAVRFLCTDPDA